MLTTGLVSLNVHEALTFDGTEIVLHPDLFASDQGQLSTVNSIATSTTTRPPTIRPSPSAASSTVVVGTVGVGGGDTSKDATAATTAAGISQSNNIPIATQEPSQQSAAAAVSAQNQNTANTSCINPAPSSDGGGGGGNQKLSWGSSGGGGGGGASSTTSQPRRLEVGDMIEIRVWDPISARDRNQSPGGVSAVFRKRSTAASVQSSQNSVGSLSTEAQKSSTGASTATKRGSNPLLGTPLIATNLTQSSSTPVTTATKKSMLDSVTSNLSRKMNADGAATISEQEPSVGSMQYSDFSASESHLRLGDNLDAVKPASSKSLSLSPSIEADNENTSRDLSRDDDAAEDKRLGTSATTIIITNNSKISSANATRSLPSSPMVPTKNVITMPSTSAHKPVTTSRGIHPQSSSTRSRADATTMTEIPRMPVAAGASLPKPPLQPRATTYGETFAAYEARKRAIKPIHSREISDMTADSIVHGLLHPHGSSHPSSSVLGGNSAIGHGNSSKPLDISVPVLSSTGSGVGGNGVGEGDDDDDTEGDDVLSVIGRTHVMRFSFVMLVAEKSLTSLKGSARTQVSILRQVADLYKLSSYDMVSINRIEKEDENAVLEAVSADFVLVSIKDQFISRGDMHLFQKSLLGSWIYEGQRLNESARGIKAHAWLLRHDKQLAKSGIVTDDTMITFRSRSSRIIWLVQMSAEMWDYASPYERERGEDHESVCEIYFDRWISFVYRLFDKWKTLEVTHSLTVVFFSRTFLSSRQAITVNCDGGTLDCKDVYGRPFEDHYKTVIENETRPDWESLVVRLKEEFLKYPLEVGWNLSTGDLGRRPSNASQGNVLEAINITSNLLQYHFLDRDLHRTGNSIVVISPGCGVFEVDKGLASITYQRMMDNGIGSDMLSLGLPPLHIAPFFLYNNEYRTVESRGVDTSETYYEIPHWMHLSFISYDSEAENMVQPEARPSEVEEGKQDLSPPLAANGFILQRKNSFDRFIPSRVKVDPSSPTSFSVNGIAASSPEKIKHVSQERALNEGRDFLDILEACRPRHSGSMPSALQAILKMFRLNEKVDRSTTDASNEASGEADTDELKPLRDWTSMDLDLDEPYKMRPRSGSFGFPDKSSERSDSSVLSSPSSSYASLVGVSFDKHLLGRPKGLGGIHLQRSPSLRQLGADFIDDTDTLKSDGSVSTAGQEGGHDAATEEDAASFKAAEKERMRRASHIRKIMENHDSNYFLSTQASAPVVSEPAPSRGLHYAALNDSVGDQSPGAGVGLPSTRNSSSRNEPSQSGGIGAALSHYTVSHDTISSGNDRIRALKTESIGSSSRTARLHDPAGSFGHRTFHWSDMGARGMSPLLLPPPGLGPGSDPPEIVRPEDQRMQTRLLPREYKSVSSVRDGGSSRSFGTGYSGRTPTNLLLSGELFVDPKLPKGEPIGGVMSVAGGSPRAGDLYRMSSARKQDKPGTRYRENSASHRHGRKKIFNPFRQADEDKVLAKRSHNRRRWSHVFPAGEIEFKRHAGPLWKSLTSPAILPLSVDYFPSRQEIDQFFQFNIYNVTLSDFENTPYSSHAELLMEMVRQRISQDYQLVPPSCVDETIHRGKPLIGHAPYGGRAQATSVIPAPSSADKSEHSAPIKHFLTMGHQLQELTYDPSSDTIEVVRFNEKSAQNDEMNTYKYQYLLYSPLTQKYSKVVQTFKKYANQYNWNKVDRIICGDEDKRLREGMRFRRVMFGLIPPRLVSPDDEQEYIAKFKRLSEYLSKLRETESASFDVRISSCADAKLDLFETRSVTGVDSMQRSAIQLRKGKQDPFEWIELATDSEFSTAKSYRIIYNWVAASSGKVDTQVQLLHRRCTQFGLSIIFFPQTSISRDLLLNPFKAPPVFCVRDEGKAKLLYIALLDLDFVNDGVFYTQTKPILECIENGDEFDFGRRLSTAARQYVHRSGTLFVRLLRDRRGWVIVVVIPNGHHIKKDEAKRIPLVKKIFRDMVHLVGSLTQDEEI